MPRGSLSESGNRLFSANPIIDQDSFWLREENVVIWPMPPVAQLSDCKNSNVGMNLAGTKPHGCLHSWNMACGERIAFLA